MRESNPSGFVARKIRQKNEENPLAVARARKEHWPAALAKVVKKAISISELLTADDQQENLRVLRNAKFATHRIFDPETRKMIEVPDHKTRLAAITLELAYTEGRPVERQLQLQSGCLSLDDILGKVKNSPTLMRSLGADLPLIDVQETRPENSNDSPPQGADAQ